MENSCTFIVFITLILLECTTHCSCRNLFNSSTDQNALLAFKATITSDPNGILAKNWSTNTSFCYWIGISCDVNHQRVTSLNVSNFHLGGTIPPHLGNLKFLTSLDVSFNNFTGNIPREIGDLSSLETLNMENNEFVTGSMPYGIFKVSSIRTINLRGCNLLGTLPSDMCNYTPKLKTLYLSRNQLFGQIPPNIYKCRDLEDMRLSFNGFTSSIPSEIGSLVNLKTLYLGNNSFEGDIPKQLGNLTSLKYLYLHDNKLTGELPHELSNLAYLEEFVTRNNVLSGSIQPFMFNISTLKFLSLSSNRFSGSLPSTIDDTRLSLINLEQLYLQNNRLSGAIPSYITNASKLINLEMQMNSFSGYVPSFDNLRLLQSLRIWNNNLTGDLRFLSSLTNCQYLQALEISGNPLTGTLPTSVGNLSTSLQDFRAAECNITGSIPSEIGNLTNLNVLLLRANRFTDIFCTRQRLIGPHPVFHVQHININDYEPSFESFSWCSPFDRKHGLSHLSTLEQLFLDDNRLSGTIPSYITNATKLTLLQIDRNSFSGHVPNFGNLRLLQIVRFSSNNFTGDFRFLTSLTNCQYLQQLQTSMNPLSGVLPTSVGNLSTTLQFFGAFGCNIKGFIPSEIGNLTGLQELWLNSNQLTGYLPSSIGKLKHLEGIYLYDNRLHGHIPHDICHVTNLVELSLYDNMLTGAIPECFGDLATLRRVYLGSNNLSSTIPSSFWNLLDLLALNLSSNHLTGQISHDFGNLKVISLLDLSSNQFSGNISSSIGSSQSIEFLSFAHNKFEGSIPKSLGNVVNLRSLDLSNNNLSGMIPKSLEGLRYLVYFNVSSNKLEGEIPAGGPFVNFTAQSFAQNFALCGATQFHVPLCVQTRIKSRQRNVIILLVRYILPPIVSTIILVIIIIVFITRRRKRNKVPPPADISLGNNWRRILYQELGRGTSAFSETNLLGKGGFGSVFKGTLSDGLNVAIKVFNLQSEGASKSFDTESEILSSVRHRNLLRIIGCCCNTEFKALIIAYMPNGSLEKWLYSKRYDLDVLQRLNIAIDVALALEYLHHGHTFPIVHCDIKPSNILLGEDMTAVVADFGLSKLFDEGEVVIQTNTLATIGYTAPEYGSEGKVSTNGDVYSYGILLLEMFTRKKPTDDMFSEQISLKDWVSEALLQENAVREIVAPGLLTSEDRHFYAKEQCVSSVFALAIECLAFSPDERINMIQVVVDMQKIKTIFLTSDIVISDTRKT